MKSEDSDEPIELPERHVLLLTGFALDLYRQRSYEPALRNAVEGFHEEADTHLKKSKDQRRQPFGP